MLVCIHGFIEKQKHSQKFQRNCLHPKLEFCTAWSRQTLSREDRPSSPHAALAGAICGHSSEFFSVPMLVPGANRQHNCRGSEELAILETAGSGLAARSFWDVRSSSE